MSDREKEKNIRINESVFTGLRKRYIDTYDKTTATTVRRRGVTATDTKAYKTPYSTKSLFSFVDHCHELRPWQRDILNKLSTTRNDFYIIAPAGGGKTAPIVCYWVNEILGLSTTPHPSKSPDKSIIQKDIKRLVQLLTYPESIDQILWLVPIQSLNSNIESEFIERFVGGIILQFLNRFVELDINNNIIIYNPTVNMILSMGSNSGETRIANHLVNMIQPPNPNAPDFLIDSLTGQQVLDQSGSPITNLTKTYRYVPNNHTELFRQQLGDLVNKYTRNCLVGIRQEHTDTHLIRGSRYPKPVVICIYESAASIINNPNYNKLRLIICDEAQRLQGSPDYDDVKRARQIATSMHILLKSKNTRQSKLVMLTATVNPKSAQNMMHFLNATYNRRFKVSTLVISPDRNPSNISVLPMTRMSTLNDQKYIIENILKRGETGVVFVIFGKKRINDLIDAIVPVESGYIASRQPLSRSGTTALYGKHNVKDIVSADKTINNISDERLRRAVSSGIGFLYRQKDEMNVMSNQKDSAIVQHLFETGKVRVLLCTDAIREGINISINTLYIPTLKKPTSRGTQEIMEIGGLTQLLNRVGRRQGVSGTIYASPEDIPIIKTALSGDLENYDQYSFEFPDENELNSVINYWLGIMRGRGLK